MSKYAIGVDYGTESGRAVLVDVETGREVGACVHAYGSGVIDETLPGSGIRLEPDWALQDPADYLAVLRQTIPALLKETGVFAEQVVGIGVDFTSCTMLPVRADATPLCMLPEWHDNPHAWVKLWKHHAAQPEADRINAVALEMGEPWLERYGGKISSEWFFSKALQILDEAPEVYRAADRLLEAGDWVVWRLTGRETRNSCAAGYKAIWSKREGYPSNRFFAALNPGLERIVDEKMGRDVHAIGALAGGLTPEAAAWTGLKPGTAVAVANVDAHVAVPATTVVEPGRMVIIMGTSSCHMVLGTTERLVPGICGYVEDGILPGFFGYEAGQSCVGDHFAWFLENAVPAALEREAAGRPGGVHAVLEERAAALRPGESGLLALDWWNGNRSVLVDAGLTGLLVGATLQTRPEEIYRALIEATAFGTRMIMEAFDRNGVPVTEVVACGGLPEKNRLLMQIYADVTGREFKLAGSSQSPALGSAMFGAVAAGRSRGGFDRIQDAATVMGKIRSESFRPEASASRMYDRLFAEYRILHDAFGRGAMPVMKRLKEIRAETRKNHAR
jgi:L-ribulokinase